MSYTIRFINPDNAEELGYYPDAYDQDGSWVLEIGSGEWVTDLTGVDETDVAGAQAAAEDTGLLGRGTWTSVIRGYGVAYRFISA